jgi:hypothetical protein
MKNKLIEKIVAWLVRYATRNEPLGRKIRAKIAFGILPDTIEEARDMFVGAGRGIEFENGFRVMVVEFTDYWKEIFLKWVELCGDEGEAKGAFFVSTRYAFYSQGQAYFDSPLIRAAGERWLSLLNQPLNKYHQEMVWKLSTPNLWCSGSETVRKMALTRRNEFAPVMSAVAQNYSQMSVAYSFAVDGSPEQAAIGASMKFRKENGLIQM